MIGRRAGLLIVGAAALIGAGLSASTEDESSILASISKPRFTLTREERNSALSTGVGIAAGVAFQLSPIHAEYEVAKKIVDIGLDTSDLAVGSRNALVEADLRVIGRDVAELERLKRVGFDLKTDPDARALLEKLRSRARGNDDAWSFFRKAIISGQGLYALGTAVAAETAFGRLHDRFISKRPLGTSARRQIRQTWRDGEHLVRDVTGVKWKGMTARASLAVEVSQRITHDVIQALIDQAIKKKATELVREQLDEAYHEALSHRAPPGYRYRPVDIRLMVLARPEAFAAVLPVPVAAIAPMPARVEAIRPAQPDPEIRQGPVTAIAPRVDPVVRTIVTEDRVQRSVRQSDRGTSRIPDIDLSKYRHINWDGRH